MEEESSPRDDDLQQLLNNISSLKSGSDLRGSYADHEGGATTIANEIAALHHDGGAAAAAAAMALFTPFAAYCIGAASRVGRDIYNKLNYYLGKRANDTRGEGRFPEIDFCRNPEATCTDDEDVRWISGIFEWIERIQSYTGLDSSISEWNYMSNFIQFVD